MLESWHSCSSNRKVEVLINQIVSLLSKILSTSTVILFIESETIHITLQVYNLPTYSQPTTMIIQEILHHSHQMRQSLITSYQHFQQIQTPRVRYKSWT